jgi:hypothetical protein
VSEEVGDLRLFLILNGFKCYKDKSMNVLSMSKLVIIILLLTTSLISVSQINFLNPCLNLGEEINAIKLYDESFDKILTTELGDDFQIRFVTKPAFAPESVFQIEKTESSIFKLKTLIFHENHWFSKNRDSAKVFKKAIEIDSELGLAYDILFHKVTEIAMSKSSYIGVGEDGVSYYFYRRSEYSDIACGECWSPEQGTLLFELVNLCEVLVNSTNINSLNTSTLKNRIYLLLQKME